MYLPKLQSAYPRQGLALFHFRAAEQDLMQNWLRFFKSLQLTLPARKLGSFFQTRESTLPGGNGFVFSNPLIVPRTADIGFVFSHQSCLRTNGFVFSNSPLHRIQPRVWLRSAKGSESKSLRLSVFEFKTSTFFFFIRINTLRRIACIVGTATMRFSYQKGWNQNASSPPNFTAQNRVPRP